MIRYLVIVLVIVIFSLFVAFLAKWQDMYREGYPANPLRWAQERRWRENASRRLRIMYLEHDLGLHADRDENCVECDKDKHRIWDNPYVAKPIAPYVNLWSTGDLYFPPPAPNAMPDRIKK